MITAAAELDNSKFNEKSFFFFLATPNFDPPTDYQQCQTTGDLMPFRWNANKKSLQTIAITANSELQNVAHVCKKGESKSIKRLRRTMTFNIYFPLVICKCFLFDSIHYSIMSLKEH